MNLCNNLTAPMETLTPSGLTWEDVCNNPDLQDLPFKIELNEHGQLIMSPTRIQHGRLQSRISHLLWACISNDAEVVTECAIATRSGTRVTDVAYFSAARMTQVAAELEASIAPEICIEILSPGNTEEEMHEKRRLYIEAGAQEVWVCDLAGTLHFFDANGRLERSKMMPAFPGHIAL